MITIRSEEPQDKEMIFEVNRLAFGQDNEARLVDQIRESKYYKPELSLVAIIDKQIAGHIMFSVVTLEHHLQLSHILALAPMAVKPEYQGQGIGARLIREGLKRAQDTGYPGVAVLGHPEYYRRFGFTRASKRGIACPYLAPDEAFMVFELKPRSLEGVKGTVKYPAFFNEV